MVIVMNSAHNKMKQDTMDTSVIVEIFKTIMNSSASHFIHKKERQIVCFSSLG